MKQLPSRTAAHRSLATWLLALLLGAACQGTGHVQELPPAALPAESQAEPAPTSGGAAPPRFAEPPNATTEPAPETPRAATAPLSEAAPWSEAAPRSEAAPLSGAAPRSEAAQGADDARGAPDAPRAPSRRSAPSGGSGSTSDGQAHADAKASSTRASRPQGSADVATRARGGALEPGPSWRRPPPEERPGLATHWGESRYSPAREVEFERAAPERPASVVELHYNDREGARRMLPDGAWGRAERVLPMGLTVRVVDAAGHTLPALVRGSRVIALGEPGERYALVIENPTPRRFEVVASVDGLDVLDGRAARVDKRGYLVAAYASVSIDGFRRSGEEVAAFRLGNVARSYAASKGQARNVGVLGVAVFDERRPRPVEPPWSSATTDDTRLRRDADPFPGGYARPPRW